MRHVFAFLLCAAALPAAEMPRIVLQGGKYTFQVDGKPFIMLGAQVHNSSGWTRSMEGIWPLVRQLHCNTVEIPVYWEYVEPQPGQFRFDLVDSLVEGARRNDLRLVLLWFATWKNGVMDYAPAWVKENPGKYPRMKDRQGQEIRVLSPHSRANLEADSRAFSAFLGHLKEIDGDRHTVIMVQVENEPGSLGSVRDFSEEANRLFAGAAPPALVERLHKKPGSWQEAFGADADETFAAWHVASYINQVAAAGKKVYPLPLYVNVWLREQGNFVRPGEAYPSGGATSNMLDVWKAAAPSIDLLAPDIYVRDYMTYRQVCESYRRPDNPLLIPESGAPLPYARYMYYALGEFDALGFAPFGIDSYGENGQVKDAARALQDNYRLLGPMLPEIAGLQGTGKLRAAVEEDMVTGRLLRFDRFDVLAQFGDGRHGYGGDFATGTKDRSGRALIAQLGPDEFLLAGFDTRVQLRPAAANPRQRAQLVTVEEGTFENGQWKAARQLNGDETFFGVSLPHEGRILRVKVMAY
jgi:hypothetical protein